MGLTWAFGTSDRFPPAKPRLLIFPNSSTNWDPRIQIHEPVAIVLIQTTSGVFTNQSWLLERAEGCWASDSANGAMRGGGVLGRHMKPNEMNQFTGPA